MVGDLGRSAWEANAPGPIGGSGAWIHLGRSLYPAIDPSGPGVGHGLCCGCASDVRTADEDLEPHDLTMVKQAFEQIRTRDAFAGWEQPLPEAPVAPGAAATAMHELARALAEQAQPLTPRFPDLVASCGCWTADAVNGSCNCGAAGVACVPNGGLCICFVQCLPGPPDGLHDCGETRVTSRPSCGPTVYSDAFDWMDDTIDDLVDDWDDRIEETAEQLADAAWALLTYTGEPPGDCTESRHRELQDAVDAACKTVSRSCNPSQSCAELSRRWSLNQACVDARQLIMDECFRGGDEGHRTRLAEEKRAVEKCRENYEKKGC